jgi:transcriptional regulator with XRE-family HTH domain
MIQRTEPRLRQLRRAFNLSQYELAARARTSQAEISSVERGLIPGPALAKRLSELFKMPAEQLFEHVEINVLPLDSPVR